MSMPNSLKDDLNSLCEEGVKEIIVGLKGSPETQTSRKRRKSGERKM